MPSGDCRSSSTPAVGQRRRPAARLRLSRTTERAVTPDLGLAVAGQSATRTRYRPIRDAFVTFPATDLVIATHPEARSNWLARNLVEQAMEDRDPDALGLEQAVKQRMPERTLLEILARTAAATGPAAHRPTTTAPMVGNAMTAPDAGVPAIDDDKRL